jgi:hypothetical protein
MKVGKEIKRCKWYLFIYLSLSYFPCHFHIFFVTFTFPFTLPSLRLLLLFASLSLYPYIQPFIHASIPSVIYLILSHISSSSHPCIYLSIHTCIHSYPSLSSLRIIRFLIDVNKAHFHMSKEGKVHDMVILSEVTVILQSH